MLLWVVRCHEPSILSSGFFSSLMKKGKSNSISLACLTFKQLPDPSFNAESSFLSWMCIFSPACLPCAEPFTVFVPQWAALGKTHILTNFLQLCFQTILCSPTLGERFIVHRCCCVSWQDQFTTSLDPWCPIKQCTPTPNYGAGLPSLSPWSAGCFPSTEAICVSAGRESVHQQQGHAPCYST